MSWRRPRARRCTSVSSAVGAVRAGGPDSSRFHFSRTRCEKHTGQRLNSPRAITSTMILGRVLGQEPHRSRVFIVAGWVVAAGGSAAMTWTVDRHSLWGLGAVAAAWLLLLIGLATILVRAFIRDFGREPRRGRPMRFALTKRGFGVATLLPGGLVAMMQLFGAGIFVAMLARWLRDVADP